MTLDKVTFLIADVDFDKSKIGMDLAEVLVHVGFAKSKTEARNHIRGGGIRINDRKVIDSFARLARDNSIGEWFLIEHEK